MNLRALALTSTALFVAACSSGSNSIAATDAPSKLAVAICARGAACCAGTTAAAQQTCVTAYSNIVSGEISSETVSGKATYSGTNASDCLDEINASACSDLVGNNTHVSACGKLVVGTVALGGACTNFADCLSELCIDGVCIAKGAQGQACPTGTNVGGNACAAGTFMSYNVNTSACVCTTFLANGSPCTSDSTCNSGYCDTAGTSTCLALTNPLPAAICQEVFGNH